MADDNPSPQRSTPLRPRRWRAPAQASHSPYRFAFRLIGIPVIAVIAVMLYRGIQARLVLPECDSGTAIRTLSEVLKQLKLEPVRYAPIETVSSSKDAVSCHAVMPLADGANVVADYRFYWQGNKADMRYSIHRETPPGAGITPPT